MTILPSYYNTFVDVMEFHELALEVITSLATAQFYFDIVSQSICLSVCLSVVYQQIIVLPYNHILFFSCSLSVILFCPSFSLSLKALNFDLTKALLNLISQYVSILYLLGQIDDRKAICALYNIAHENTRGSR